MLTVVIGWFCGMPLFAQEVLPPAMKAQRVDYCIHCHKTLSGQMGVAVGEWEKSVHAKRDDNCNICHGGNPDLNDKKAAKDIKFGFAAKRNNYNSVQLCGRGGCHASTIGLFKMGPHYVALGKKGKPECVDCHGAHEILPPKVKFIKTGVCVQCHTAGVVEKTIASLEKLEQNIADLEKNIDYLISKNAEARDILAKLIDVRNLYRQLVHVMSTREFQHTKREIELQLNDLLEKSQSRLLVVRRLDINYVVTMLLGFLVVIVFMIFTIRTFARRSD
ncbi:MAG: hypothetical protein N2316_01705 [Spirochaetes bacterium]|nr:hypothetical protein [Spirochaetota bacterium]